MRKSRCPRPTLQYPTHSEEFIVKSIDVQIFQSTTCPYTVTQDGSPPILLLPMHWKLVGHRTNDNDNTNNKDSTTRRTHKHRVHEAAQYVILYAMLLFPVINNAVELPV